MHANDLLLHHGHERSVDVGEVVRPLTHDPRRRVAAGPEPEAGPPNIRKELAAAWNENCMEISK